ncbi:MAG: hypothetical protein WB780_06720 [Candidatus Acidiferrales bacterium]
MKYAKRMLMVAGALALAGILGVAIVPKAAHGLVAAMVQVVNTSANPVPTLEEDAQTAFVANNFCHFGGPPDDTAFFCDISPLFQVPAGKTAVIESFTGFCTTDSPSGTQEFLLRFLGPSGTEALITIPASTVVPSSIQNVSFAALNFKSYASGGASGAPINFQGEGTSNESTTDICQVSLSGHLVSTP